GLQFPLIIGLYGRGKANVGKHVGEAYLANTIGGIAGAIGGGFGLLPLLSAPTCWKVIVGLLVATAGLAIALAVREKTDAKGRGARNRRGAIAIVAGTFAISFLFALGPTAVWRHSGIG